jgi:hypothetical protein
MLAQRLRRLAVCATAGWKKTSTAERAVRRIDCCPCSSSGASFDKAFDKI